MNRIKPTYMILAIIAGFLTSCTPSVCKQNSASYHWKPVPPVVDGKASAVWSAYPVIAHTLNSGEAPIVRWIDTDGDGISNYRLLCTFKDGLVRVHKVVSDTTFRQKFKRTQG